MDIRLCDKQFTRKLLALTIGMVAIPVAAGAQQPPNDEEISLRVQYQTGENNLALAQWMELKFEEKFPNVDVVLQAVSQDQKTGANLAVLGSGSPPDVGIIPINSQVYSQLLAANALLPLDDVYASGKLTERYAPAVVDSVMVNGTPYIAPYIQVTYGVIWANRDLFKKAGIEFPSDHRIESVQQLIDWSGKPKEAGGTAFQLAGASGYQASWMLDAFLTSALSPDQHQNLVQNYDPAVDVTVKYDGPEFILALQTLKDVNDAETYQPGFLGQKAEVATTPFLIGQAGMLLGGTFTVFEIDKAEPDFEYDWLILPPVKEGATSLLTQYYGDALGVPANAAQPEWAKAFIEFSLSDDVQHLGIIEEVAMLPAVNSLPDEAFESIHPKVREILKDTAENGGVPGWTSSVPGGLGQQYIDPMIQGMYAGSKTPEDIAAAMQARLEELREAGE